MSISFSCPNCTQTYKANDRLSGQVITCRTCGEAIAVFGVSTRPTEPDTPRTTQSPTAIMDALDHRAIQTDEPKRRGFWSWSPLIRIGAACVGLWALSVAIMSIAVFCFTKKSPDMVIGNRVIPGTDPINDWFFTAFLYPTALLVLVFIALLLAHVAMGPSRDRREDCHEDRS